MWPGFNLGKLRMRRLASWRGLSLRGCVSGVPCQWAPGRFKSTRELVLVDIPYIIPYRISRDVEILCLVRLCSNLFYAS